MMTFNEKIEWLFENGYDVHSYDDMKDIAKNAIESGNLMVAIHILQAINSDPDDYYHYDNSMGTLETPTSIDDEYADYLMEEYGYTKD